MHKLWKVDYDVAEQMLNMGKTPADIAEKFGATPGSVRQGLNRRGFTLRKFGKLNTQLTDIMWAYIAGLFDGEGSININRKNRQFWLTADIGTTSIKLVDWLKQHIGGHVRISTKSNRKHKTGYHWTVCSRQATYFLQEIMPYLIIKKDEASVAIKFQNRMKPINFLTNKEIDIRTQLKKELETLR